jgi:hypothetical protein
MQVFEKLAGNKLTEDHSSGKSKDPGQRSRYIDYAKVLVAKVSNPGNGNRLFSLTKP